jgi:ATP-dependent RNA helicase DeaD
VPAVEIAAALASLVQGKTPLFVDVPTRSRETPVASAAAAPSATPMTHSQRRKAKRESRQSGDEVEVAPPPAIARTEEPRGKARRSERAPSEEFMAKRNREREVDATLETYRVEVGAQHGIKPGNIVGAIANETGIEGKFIGRVVINEDHSFVDLPEGMPKEVFRSLQKVRVGGQPLQISRALQTQVNKMRRERSEAPRSRKKTSARR